MSAHRACHLQPMKSLCPYSAMNSVQVSQLRLRRFSLPPCTDRCVDWLYLLQKTRDTALHYRTIPRLECILKVQCAPPGQATPKGDVMLEASDAVGRADLPKCQNASAQRSLFIISCHLSGTAASSCRRSRDMCDEPDCDVAALKALLMRGDNLLVHSQARPATLGTVAPTRRADA